MRFSIIIPVYNVKDYLQKCIDSVLANDCADCEIILVNDGSTDGASPAICDENAARHPDLIRVIHQENQGLGGARNTGIAAARGEYLFFVDSDDTIAPYALKVLSEAAANYGADVFSFDFTRDDGNGGLFPESANRGPVGVPFTLAEKPEFLLSLPAAWARIWRRSLFAETTLQYPSRVWYEDIRTSTKLFAKARSIVILPEHLYFYLLRPGSIMNNRNLQRNREILDAFDDILNWFRQENLAETYSKELCALAIWHILLTASVRVARTQPDSPLLSEFSSYMEKHFPDFRQNPYRASFPAGKRLALFLVEHRRYKTIRLLFRLKG